MAPHPAAALLLLLLVSPSHGRSSSPDGPAAARNNPLLRRPRLRNPIRALSESGTAWGSVGADVVAGSGAALVAYTIATPFETVKTNNQMMGGRTRDTLKAVLERGGKRSLVSGSSLRAMWTAGVPYSMILYSVYRPLKAASRRAVAQVRGIEDSAGDFAADMLAAAGAEVLGLFAFIPGELVAKRMMVDPTRYAGVGSALRSIVAEGGARSAFTGFGACLVRDVPYTAIQFAMFDALASRVLAAAATADGDLRFDQSLAIGAGAAVVASVVTLPIDVLKSQVMIAADKVNIPALVSSIVQSEGPGVFFRGLPTYMTINIAKWSSSQAVYNKLRGTTEV